ncbi:MAG: hypothetical protein VR64_09210 [Desulfatitalea sp. BRH_c12]|nr:MAG: hypothetical protein VR64_09210 [Desulfatitalea sp. BRH_c12]
MYRLWLGLVLVLVIHAGCGDGKTKQLNAALEKSKATIQAISDENSQLKEQISRLQTEFNDLQNENSNLKISETELQQWSRQLAEQLGPAVWYPGPYERPLPRKIIERATAEKLVQSLNDLFRQAQLPEVILLKVLGDTAFVDISQDEQLTQQMGSTGATGYIQAVTYTLTSLPGIHYVDFQFKEGDHAVPGRYSR